MSRLFPLSLRHSGVEFALRRLGSQRYVEWHARRIPDPIARLRYLRGAGTPPRAPARSSIRPWRAALCFAVLALIAVRSASDASGRRSSAATPRPAALTAPAAVWMVESNPGFEVYSNGLRIENRLAVSNQPRRFAPYDRRDPKLAPGPAGSEPAGIVYHTTESQGAPFEPRQNQVLKRQGDELLQYVRDKRAYHFVIDRFGRVHRIVRESDVAFHAGHSIWADPRWVYVGLNASFLGISFEGETRRLRDELTPAQVHAGRVLTEMLRSRYHILAGNCVTHAQVSVNPDNMRIGYHTDWAGNFPFREMGLDDNYAEPIPAIYLFGYSYDPAFIESTGARLWKGLLRAEERLEEDATVSGRTRAEHQKILQQRYRDKEKETKLKAES